MGVIVIVHTQAAGRVMQPGRPRVGDPRSKPKQLYIISAHFLPETHLNIIRFLLASHLPPAYIFAVSSSGYFTVIHLNTMRLELLALFCLSILVNRTEAHLLTAPSLWCKIYMNNFCPDPRICWVPLGLSLTSILDEPPKFVYKFIRVRHSRIPRPGVWRWKNICQP